MKFFFKINTIAFCLVAIMIAYMAVIGEVNKPEFIDSLCLAIPMLIVSRLILYLVNWIESGNKTKNSTNN